MRFHLTRRDDKRQTANKQGKIGLLSLWAVGRPSFAIKCLSNGLYSLNNCPKPFSKGFHPPPSPPCVKSPFEQHLWLIGSSLTLGMTSPHYSLLIFGYLNCQRTTKGSLDVYGCAFFRGGRGVFPNFYFWKICFDGRSGW